MNRIEQIALMATYDQWMNRKVYDAAAKLTDAELRMDRRAFFGSILGTLHHLTLGDTEWLKRRLVPQSLRTFEQPAEAVGGEKLKRAYIYCSSPAIGAFDQVAARLRADRKWTYHELKTGHDAMVTAPGEVAKILLGLAR